MYILLFRSLARKRAGDNYFTFTRWKTRETTAIYHNTLLSTEIARLERIFCYAVSPLLENVHSSAVFVRAGARSPLAESLRISITFLLAFWAKHSQCLGGHARLQNLQRPRLLHAITLLGCWPGGFAWHGHAVDPFSPDSMGLGLRRNVQCDQVGSAMKLGKVLMRGLRCRHSGEEQYKTPHFPT